MYIRVQKYFCRDISEAAEPWMARAAESKRRKSRKDFRTRSRKNLFGRFLNNIGKYVILCYKNCLNNNKQRFLYFYEKFNHKSGLKNEW